MHDDRLPCEAQVLLGVALAQRRRLLERHLRRDVAGQGIVRGGLIRDEIELLPAGDEFRKHVRGVRPERDGERAMLRSRVPHARQRVVEGRRLYVDVARLEPAVDRPLVDLHAEDRRTRQGRR